MTHRDEVAEFLEGMLQASNPNEAVAKIVPASK
jgi:hypothetical protein